MSRTRRQYFIEPKFTGHETLERVVRIEVRLVTSITLHHLFLHQKIPKYIQKSVLHSLSII